MSNNLLVFVSATFMSLLATNLFIYSDITHLVDIGAPNWIVGFFYYSCFAPFLFTFFWVGRLTDRSNKKLVLILALIGLAMAMEAQVLLTSIHTSSKNYIGVGILFGLSFLFVPSSRYALIADCFSTVIQGRALMLANACAVLSMSTAPLLQSVLRQFHYADLAVDLSVILILLAVIIYSRVKIRTIDCDVDPPHQNNSPQNTYFLLAYCALGICLLGPLQTMLPELVISRYHFNPIERDKFMALLGLGVVLSVPITKTLMRINGARDFLLGMTLSGLCMCIAFAGSAISLGIIIIGCAMVSGSLINLIQINLQARVPRHQQGQLMARLAMVSLGVPSIAAGLMGGIATEIGIDASFMLLSATLALGFIVLEALRSDVRQILAK